MLARPDNTYQITIDICKDENNAVIRVGRLKKKSMEKSTVINRHLFIQDGHLSYPY